MDSFTIEVWTIVIVGSIAEILRISGFIRPALFCLAFVTIVVCVGVDTIRENILRLNRRMDT